MQSLTATMSIMEDHGHLKETGDLEHRNLSSASTVLDHSAKLVSKTGHVRLRIANPNPA